MKTPHVRCRQIPVWRPSMTELGQTDDPRELVKGDPAAIEENARVLRARADRAEWAADGLKAIDSGSWEGDAAKVFHEKFSYEPGKWLTAANCLQAGAAAIEDYAGTLRWAQGQAAEAIRLWSQAGQATQQAQVKHQAAAEEAAAHNQPVPPFTDPGAADRQAAQETLSRARIQVDQAGDIASEILRGETAPSPQESSWHAEIGKRFRTPGPQSPMAQPML